VSWTLEITPGYQRRLIRFLKKHPAILPKYEKTILLLEADPFHPSLRLHRLSGRLRDLHSVSIDMRYRISIEFYIEDERIVPVAIGTHDEVYRG
jgi:mRNA-degrading endonuclease YafQ of YafQ-DinJ toxin-antitoxin module